jgi:hypothetical protein
MKKKKFSVSQGANRNMFPLTVTQESNETNALFVCHNGHCTKYFPIFYKENISSYHSGLCVSVRALGAPYRQIFPILPHNISLFPYAFHCKHTGLACCFPFSFASLLLSETPFPPQLKSGSRECRVVYTLVRSTHPPPPIYHSIHGVKFLSIC